MEIINVDMEITVMLISKYLAIKLLWDKSEVVNFNRILRKGNLIMVPFYNMVS